ncbi:MAG TPA: MMPL family transporter [Flavobacterium sp.]|nr:MMPL family transporter [Flavobacterium sp.]
MGTKRFKTRGWEKIARVILKNRIAILVIIGLLTAFFAWQWRNVHMTYTEANLVPKDHIINQEYRRFLERFGEEGNLIVLGVQDERFFTPKAYAEWDLLMRELGANKGVDLIISVNDLQTLGKDTVSQKFVLSPLVDKTKTGDATYLTQIKKQLFDSLPFYEGLLFNKESGSIRSAVYLNKNIVNTQQRKTFILDEVVPAVDRFEKSTGIDLKVSGMPYIRTINAEDMKAEVGLFIGAAFLVTSLIFFFFFRSFRAMFISVGILVIGVMCSFGTLGLFGYTINILTSVIPPLLIVIGIANCIFLINKYQQEIKLHNNQAKALQRVVSKIGMSTLMTNLTTAAGFATFMFTGNELLFEFGLITSINILALYLLTLVLVPIIYSFMPLPKAKHLHHLDRRYIANLLTAIQNTVKTRRNWVYAVYILLLGFSLYGLTKIRVSGSLLSEMPKTASFYNDIVFYENQFNGVMPMEVLIDTKRPKGVMKLSTLKRMDRLQDSIAAYDEFSTPVSVVNLVKFSKQAYYNGNPEFYELPNQQEQAFILSYAKNATRDSKQNLLKSYVDSTGQFARMTVFMKDVGTSRMAQTEARLRSQIDEIFPPDRYTVTLTGKALVFQKGTSYLVENLKDAILFAILMVAALMTYMFRSVKMILVALITNILPLCITSGLMGFFDIPLKPSTILVFSIAFGISVDNAIQFMAKYRHDLIANRGRVKRSVMSAIRETGVSTFYTSVVLIFGFGTFALSSFAGTIALGGLIACTLTFAMFANLLMLPSLVLTFEKKRLRMEELVDDGILEDDEPVINKEKP